MKESLTKALEELKAGGYEGDLPDPAMVAERIEATMYKHFGGHSSSVCCSHLTWGSVGIACSLADKPLPASATRDLQLHATRVYHAAAAFCMSSPITCTWGLP